MDLQLNGYLQCSYSCIFSITNTMFIYYTYLINHLKIAIVRNTIYICWHQIQCLTSAFRTQIHIHMTYLLLKFFVYSRCCKFIDTSMSNLLLKVFPWSIKSTVHFAQTAVFSIYFPYIEIQNRGMYCDVISQYAFIIISKRCVTSSVLRYITCKFTSYT